MNRKVVRASFRMLAVIVLLVPAPAAAEGTATLDVKLSVRGMTCSGCVSNVKAALEKVPGVSKAEVSLDENEAAVTYEKGKTTSFEQCRLRYRYIDRFRRESQSIEAFLGNRVHKALERLHRDLEMERTPSP